jgi:hypothetical protein
MNKVGKRLTTMPSAAEEKAPNTWSRSRSPIAFGALPLSSADESEKTTLSRFMYVCRGVARWVPLFLRPPPPFLSSLEQLAVSAARADTALGLQLPEPSAGCLRRSRLTARRLRRRAYAAKRAAPFARPRNEIAAAASLGRTGREEGASSAVAAGPSLEGETERERERERRPHEDGQRVPPAKKHAKIDAGLLRPQDISGKRECQHRLKAPSL